MWTIWNDVGRKRQVLLKCKILGSNWDSYQFLMRALKIATSRNEGNTMILQCHNAASCLITLWDLEVGEIMETEHLF